MAAIRKTEPDTKGAGKLLGSPENDLGKRVGFSSVSEAGRERSRLAQATALQHMLNGWRGSGRVVSLARRTGGSSLSGEMRARLAEYEAVEDFLSRPPLPHAPLRSI